MLGKRTDRPGSWGEGTRGLVVMLVLACLTSAAVGCSPGREEAQLQRLFVYLPPLPEHPSPDEVTVSFSDLAELKRQYGLPEDITFEDAPASLMGELLKVVGLGGICTSIEAHIQVSRARMDLGYDVMAVQRCIEGSGVTWMEGDFDPRQVAASLESLGYDVEDYQGIATYHFNAGKYTGDEAGRKLAEAAGHVAVLKGAVITAATAERLHAALDTWKGRTGGLSSVARYTALVRALGPVVSARVFPVGDRLAGVGYQESVQKKRSFSAHRPGPCEGRDAPSWMWLSEERVEQTRYVVLASTYASAEEARAGGERLVESLATHALAPYWQKVDEPTVTAFEEGAILALAVELKGEVPADILGQVIAVMSGGPEGHHRGEHWDHERHEISRKTRSRLTATPCYFGQTSRVSENP